MLLPLGTYRLTAPAASARRLVNAYAQAAPPERPKEQPAYVVRPPGILAWGDTAAVECRGAVMMAGTLYVCAGTEVFSVDSSGNASALSGDAVSGNGPVRMATNGTSFVVIPGNGDGYSSDGSAVSEIVDSTFTGWGALDVAYIEGYYVFVRPDTPDFFNPNVDSLTFNALKITAANSAPDNLIGIAACRGELMLAGTDSFERWYDAGLTPGSPFARSPSGQYGFGCAAGKSLAVQQDITFMLGKDKTFRRFGGSWEPVSHPGIDSIMLAMASVSDCYAIPYSHSGHHFIAWTFRNAGRTLVYDLTTGEWHERESRISTVSLGYWRPAFVIEAYGKQIVGDSQSGKLGILDANTFEEWGEPQVMSWTYPNVYASGNGASHRELEIGIAGGQGTLTGQGSNPLMTLHVSDDGGNTFRARPVRELGKIGEYRRRVRYFNLGNSRDRVYRCDVSDPVPVMILDTKLTADGVRL